MFVRVVLPFLRPRPVLGRAAACDNIPHEDNERTNALAENSLISRRRKHIDTRRHFIRDLVKVESRQGNAYRFRMAGR